MCGILWVLLSGVNALYHVGGDVRCLVISAILCLFLIHAASTFTILYICSDHFINESIV